MGVLRVLVGALVALGAAAQTCARLDPTDASVAALFAGNVCPEFAPFDVFVPPGGSAVQQLGIAEGLVTLVMYDSDACQVAAKKLFCAMFVPRCESTVDVTRPCRSLCQAALDECPFLSSVLDGALDCATEPLLSDAATCDTLADVTAVPYPRNDVVSGDTDVCEQVRADDGTPFWPRGDYQTITPPGAGIEFLEASVREVTALLPLLQASKGGQACAQSLTRLTCTAAIRKIDTEVESKTTYLGELSAPVAIPVTNPCRSSCAETNELCGPFGIPPIDCEEVDPSSGSPLFLPDDETTVIRPLGFPMPLTCTRLEETTTVQDYPCVPPLMYDPDLDPVCTPGCISPVFSEERFDRGKNMLTWISHVSLFADLFVIVTWMMFPARRKFPSILSMYLAITSACVALSVVLVSWAGHRTAWCESATVPSDGTGLCGFQAVLLHFTALASVLWWLMIIISLHQLVCMENKHIERLHIPFHIVVWGFSFVATAIAGGVGALGFASKAGLVCLYNDFDGGALDDAPYDWMLFYGPIGVFLAIGFTLVAFTMAKIIKITRAAGSATLSAQIRILKAVFAIFFIFLFIFVYRINTAATSDELEDAFEASIVCTGTTGELCEPTKTTDYTLWILNYMALSVQGIMVFFLFGLTQQNFDHWKHYISTGERECSDGSRESQGRSSRSSGSRSLSRRLSRLRRSSSQAGAQLNPIDEPTQA